jgi:multiple sugar transport system substrate-binding protein
VVIGVALIFTSCAPAATPTKAPVTAPTKAPVTEPTKAPAKLPYEGVTLKIIANTGPFIIGPVYKYAPEFEKRTGAKISASEFPFADLNAKVLQIAAVKGTDFDLLLIPNTWMADLAEMGYLTPLDPFIEKDKNDPELAWDDIPEGIKRKDSWGGHVYCIIVDNDNHTLFYRKDVLGDPKWQEAYKKETGKDLPNPPTTIDEMLEVAKFFKGKDWAGDGHPEKHYSFVSSITRGNQAFWYSYSWFSAYGVVPTDKAPAPGIFIFKPDMTPLINNPGYVKGLEKYKEMVDCCIRPGKDAIRGDVINEMINGTTLMAIDWGDIGPSSIGKDSVVKGKIGFALAPGSKEYYDWQTNQWVKTDTVKYSPTHAFNGWAWMIASTSKNQQAAWDFIKFMASPTISAKTVASPDSGCQPWRISHATNIDPWVEAGWIKEDAVEYVKNIVATTDHPNAVFDLRIPGAARYQEAVELWLTRALAGEISPQEAMDKAAADLNKITDELGRDKQIAAYKSHLGLK